MVYGIPLLTVLLVLLGPFVSIGSLRLVVALFEGEIRLPAFRLPRLWTQFAGATW